MSAVSDAMTNFGSSLTAKLQDIQQNAGYFTEEAGDPTTIRTTKNLKIIGSIDARGDIEGNKDLT